jgi:tRNA/tmRNA/rRNA uracil-C5-methylase (TrmA/RlmC/RlmD family)
MAAESAMAFDGALPGELVEVTVATRHGADQGTVTRVLEPSPDRIAMDCRSPAGWPRCASG